MLPLYPRYMSQSASSYLAWSIFSVLRPRPDEDTSLIPCPRSPDLSSSSPETHYSKAVTLCPIRNRGDANLDSQSQRVFVRDLSSTPRCVRQNTCYTQQVLSRKLLPTCNRVCNGPVWALCPCLSGARPIDEQSVTLTI